MRLLRLGCGLLAAAALLAGCGDDESRSDRPSTPTVTASPTQTPTLPSTAPSTPSVSYGSDGFTVRYLDSDGKIQTLQPKDFPR